MILIKPKGESILGVPRAYRVIQGLGLIQGFGFGGLEVPRRSFSDVRWAYFGFGFREKRFIGFRV